MANVERTVINIAAWFKNLHGLQATESKAKSIAPRFIEIYLYNAQSLDYIWCRWEYKMSTYFGNKPAKSIPKATVF
jgi:hypothetical protein